MVNIMDQYQQLAKYLKEYKAQEFIIKEGDTQGNLMKKI